MTTIRDMVDSVVAEVRGEAATVESSSSLLTSIDADDTSLQVVDGNLFSRGIVEIEEELLLVRAVNRSDGTLTCAPQGRGIRATKAAAHSAGAQVTMSPIVPRARAHRAILEALRADSGLFAVGSLDLTYAPMQGSYPLPADVGDVLSVTWEPGITIDVHPVPVRRWSFDRHSGRLILGDPIRPGAMVHVSYSLSPIIPTSIDDDFATTGLPESCIDVIRFSAAWRVSSFMESHNLMAQKAEADAMDRARSTSGSRLRISQYFYNLYQQRLAEEVGNLQRRWPIRTHFTVS